MAEWRGEYDCYAQELSPTTYYDFFSGETKDKIPTPLDNLGLVDRHRLVGNIIAQTPPGHDWGDEPRDHHWQWREDLYPYIKEEGRPNPALFRNLLINKTILPVTFERRIHHTTLEPEVPELEVMSVMIEYGKVAHALFSSAREIIKWQNDVRSRRSVIKKNPWMLEPSKGSDHKAREITRGTGHSKGAGFGRHLAHFKEIHPEFRLVDTDGTPHQVIADLNHIVGRRVLNLAQAA